MHYGRTHLAHGIGTMLDGEIRREVTRDIAADAAGGLLVWLDRGQRDVIAYLAENRAMK